MTPKNYYFGTNVNKLKISTSNSKKNLTTEYTEEENIRT